MKRLNKTLVLCAVMILIIATVFTLSACQNSRKVEGITVEIIDGGDRIVLTPQEASVNAIVNRINVYAQLKDGTAKALVGYSVEDFDPELLDEVQTVKIVYSNWTATVQVLVSSVPVEPQIVSIAVTFDGDKIVLQETAATEAAIFEAITVKAIYDDDSEETLTEGLTLEGFDATVLDTDQSVRVVYGELKSDAFTVVVESDSEPDPDLPTEPTVESITVTINAGGDKVVLSAETASEQALRALITVKANMSDKTSNTVTDYTVLGLDLDKVNENQTVTIKYCDFTKTITVLIEDDSEPEPDPTIESIEVIIKEGADKVTMQKDSASKEALKALITVNAVMSDDTKKEISDYEILNLDLAKYNEDQTVTIKHGGFEKTITVFIVDDTEPEPDPTIESIEVIIKDGADKVTMQKDSASKDALKGLITVNAVMSDDTKKEISDYEILNLDLAKYNEDQTVTIKYGELTAKLTVLIEKKTDPDPIPEYEVYVIVNNDEEHKTVLTKNPSPSDKSEKFIAEYMGTLTLKKGDKVVIKDSDGKTYSQYEYDCPFQGTANKEGKHDFYVKFYTDGHSIWVQEPVVVDPGKDDPNPQEGFYMRVDGGEAIAISTKNPENDGEVMLLGHKLTEGAKVVVYLGGKALPFKIQNGCKFNGTVYLTGEYDFYVGEDGVWVTNWIQVAAERDGTVVTTVVADLDNPGDLDTGKYSVQYKAVITLKKGDKLVIKDISGTTIKIQSDCPNMPSTAIAPSDGDYTLYIK